MTIRNPIKKALPFAVAALLSLVSLGVHEPAEPNENQPMMHDSLYDSWVATAYNALPDNPDIEPCLDGFYAPVYFSNLRTNFGTNRFGTCAFVALAMLFSFYDTYWDDSIVPCAYEAHSTFQSGFPSGSLESPGSNDSLSQIGNYDNFGQYLSSGVPSLKATRLDAKLIDIALSYNVPIGQDSNQAGLDYSGMYSLFQYYLYSYMCFSTSDIGFIAEAGTGTGQARSESIREFAIEKVSEGTPVLLSVGTDYASITGRHAVIAYDYDESNDLLYCHMGWGPKATHVTIESFGYTSYNSAFSLAVRTQHQHTHNYVGPLQNENTCACRFAAPYDIKAVDWYRNEEPGFEWSCLNEERWVGSFEKYEISVPGCVDYDDPTENKWSVPWILKHNNGNRNTFIYDSSNVTATVNALYDDDDFGISSIERSSSFPGPTDFSGAHNIHPGDYAYSPNNPMQTGMTAHSVDGFSFKTSRKGVYEDQGMVSLVYAGSGFNDAYIQYYDFPQGDTVIGLDLGIRLWEDTNATHDLRIEYYDGNSWQVSADLLESAYGISGSDGDVCWVHHSFGTPVSAFSIHASSANPSYGDDGVAGLLTVAIYTVHEGILPKSGSELPYLPCFWNNDSTIKNYSNCYRYALNFPNAAENQDYWNPGSYAINGYYQGCTKEIIVGGALMDANEYKTDFPSSSAFFGRIGRMEVCPAGCYKVALYINQNNNGFHWFRQNSCGYWSQKDGSSSVTAFDDGGNYIVDPQFCETSYNYFCGYYCVGPWTNHGTQSN